MRYVLLLWLGALSLCPFDLSSADSSILAVGDEGPKPLVLAIVEACGMYLSDAGATRDAAAMCLAKLLTRCGQPLRSIRARSVA